METFLGSICTFGFNFAPYGWQMCAGQILPISQYAALFSLLGTSFGGNGTSTFGLPNLVGNATIGMGGNYTIGETGGVTSVTLNLGNLPAHTHQVSVQVNGNGRDEDTNSPNNTFPSVPSVGGANVYDSGFTSGVNLGSKPVVSMGMAGGNSPVSVLRPSLVVTCCIALQGVFPTRG